MNRQSTMSFNAEMARALWEGRMTQTWRLIRPQPMPLIPPADWPPAKHRVGERLIVKEPWLISKTWNLDGDLTAASLVKHAREWISFEPNAYCDKWRSASFMPLCEARQAITITGIRPMRLEDVAEEGAWAEGFEPDFRDNNGNCWMTPARAVFLDAIREIYKLAHDANPWGWRYTFTHERIAHEAN